MNHCPHCAGQYNAASLIRHVAVCPRNPALRAVIHDVLADKNNTGFAVSTAVYRARTHGKPHLPSHETLRRVLGGWTDICTFFGLLPRGEQNRPVYKRLPPGNAERATEVRARREEAAIAAAAAAQEQARAVIEQEKNRGLATCGSRRLPDGRIAHMLK